MNDIFRISCFNRYAFLYITIVAVLTVAVQGCSDNENVYPAPVIGFDTGNGLISNDTVLLLSDTVYFRVTAETRSDMPLTHFNYTITADSVVTSVDTGIFETHFVYDKMAVKGIAYEETWAFYVRDRYGIRSETISVKLTKDSASIFGDITHIPSVVMGAQENSGIGSFYSLSEEVVYTQDEAYNNQDKTDLLYFYDLLESDENTVSSPGANIDVSVFPGSMGLENWTTRRTTRFVYQDAVSIADFEGCTNDSLILEHTFIYSSGKRKAKNLQPGDIYSFILNDDGKKGMFRVLDVQGQETGAIEIEIKIQE